MAEPDAELQAADWLYPRWIAHRGAGRDAPENTLAAFRVGAAHGFRAFECDVKLSADGVPFLLHDDTLDRTTNGSGVAGGCDWQELAVLDAGRWHGAALTGEPLPTLDAVAAFCIDADCALNIEIKPTPGHEAETGRVVAAHAALAFADAPTPPLLSSFSRIALDAARRSAPPVRRALLLSDAPLAGIDDALALDCCAIVVRHDLIDAALAARAAAAGLRLLAYTVNDAAEARRLLALGVIGLITDRMDLAST